jgi:RNA-directed DNA polymerase
LEPIAEVLGDDLSFGFRPNRSIRDAIANVYMRAAHPDKGFNVLLDADIKGFFDNISHDWLLKNIPMNKIILEKFLKAGF